MIDFNQRKQIIYCGSTYREYLSSAKRTSAQLTLTFDVPQGSAPGPDLFLHCTNLSLKDLRSLSNILLATLKSTRLDIWSKLILLSKALSSY